MPEQVAEALESFDVRNVEIRRMGLTMEQIRKHQPPPSAAKQSSSRIQSYIEATGTNQAWELDALKPAVIQDLITEQMDEIIDWDLWNEAIESERIGRLKMLKVMNNWDRIMEFLDEDEDDDDDY